MSEVHSSERLVPTSFFHSRIEEIAQGRTIADCVPAVGAATGDAERLRASLELELLDWCTDFDAGHADEHAATIARALTSQRADSPESLADRTAQVFAAQALAFAELIGCFIIEIGNEAIRQRLSQLLFFARDAIPLYIVAKTFVRRGLELPPLQLLELNRAMFPQFPSTLRRGDQASLRLLHLLAGKDCASPGLVDTGAYGTLKRHLDDLEIFPHSEVLFFYSKSARHFGFLNRFAKAGAAPSQCEVICDSIEAWPKPYKSSLVFEVRGEPTLLTEATGQISTIASWSIYHTLAAWAGQVDIAKLDANRAFERLVSRPIPLMLGRPLKQWDHAAEWLSQQDAISLSAE